MNSKITLILASILIFTFANALAFEQPLEYHRTGEDYTSMAPRASNHTDDSEWLYNLAWAYYEAGMNDDALRYMRKALELKPNEAFLNAKMGDIFNKIGEQDSTVYYYEAALNNHYEYIEVWDKLVKLAPEYYGNLGLLYTKEAEKTNDTKLVSSAKEYLNEYIERFPDGEYVDQSKASIVRLDLLERQGQSRDNLRNEYLNAQAEEAHRKAEMKEDSENFHTEKPFLAGIGFYSIGMANDQDFLAKNPDEVINDTLSLKTYATSLSEFGASFGYVMGPLFLRAGFRFGSNSSGKNYFYRDPVEWDVDSSTAPWDSTLSTKDDVRPKVSSVDTWRVTVGADYNFYYRNPVILFAGAQAGIGIAKLNDSPYNNFESISLAGAGLGGGIMFRFSDFLIEFAYRQNVVGSSSGGTMVVGGSYKF